MNEPSPLLQQCFSEVLEESPRLLGRCLEAMIQALIGPQQRQGEVLVADGTSAAWSGLMRHRTTWARAFPQRLREAFERGDDGTDSGTIPLQTDSAHLALVDEADYNEQIEFKRMLQQLQPLVEQELAALDARMSSLVGLSTVHADRNPLRPPVMARELINHPDFEKTDTSSLLALAGGGACALRQQAQVRPLGSAGAGRLCGQRLR